MPLHSLVRALGALICLCACTNVRAQDQVFSMPHCGKLPKPTQMLGAAVVGDRLYAIGGDSTTGWSDEVWSAPIKPDATLGDWRAEKSLPERRSYLSNCTEVVNNRIYLVGGMTATDPHTSDSALQRVRDVLWTTVQPDGTLADWKHSEPWPGTTLNLPATCSTDKFLLLTGGSSNKAAVDQVLVADLAPDGSPTNWHTGANLPQQRFFHGAGMLGNRIYIWTGLPDRGSTNLNPMDSVYSAEISDAGQIGQWREESALPQALYSSANCAVNDYLVSVGGRYARGYPTNVIWFARLDNGKVQQWQMLKTDLETRIYHTVALDRTHGWVFIVGGREKTLPGIGGGKLVDAIQAFQLSQPEGAKLKQAEVSLDTRNTAMVDNLPKALESARGGKTVLAFFYAPEVPACKRVWDQVITSPQYQQLSSRYILANIDISAPAGKELVQKFGVYRVPVIAEISGDGRVLKRSNTISTMADVQTITGN
jgi:thiol-disulfide isomerase/thioredoxin